MKEWFKARNMWGSAIHSLPDDAAGRLAKALWDFTMNGTIPELNGPEQYILPMFIATLEQDAERESEISAKRAVAGSMGGKQRVANEANAIFATQVLPNASIKNKNKNKNKNEEQDIRVKRFTPPSIEEVTEYCNSRGNSVDPESFINFYESKGWKVGNSPMKDWKACVRTWEKRGIVKYGTRPPTKLNADNFEQRDYSDVNKQLLDGLISDMRSFKEEQG